MGGRSARAILSLRYTAFGAGAVRSIGRFLRYVQYRDHSQAREREDGVDGFLRYAAYRDRTTPEARLFDREGDADERDRRALNAYVKRSGVGISDRTTGRGQHQAAYRFVISPEDARGLDLRELTRATMAQLERDAGPGGLPPWIAAKHRNTDHPHVHVVMAARRAVERDRFRTVVITKARLQRMKDSLAREMNRQRGRQLEREDPVRRLIERARGRRPGRSALSHQFSHAMARLAAQYLREAEMDRSRESQWER